MWNRMRKLLHVTTASGGTTKPVENHQCSILYSKIYNAPQNNPVSWRCKNCRTENKRDTSRNNKLDKLNDRNHPNNTLTETAHILASKKDHNSSQNCDSTLIQDLLSHLEKTEATNVELQNIDDLL